METVGIEPTEDSSRPRRRSSHGGYVYFIQQGNDGAIKIGWTKNPRKRLGELQIGCPDPLVLLGAVPVGSRGEEREIQHALWDWHVRGEWFDGGMREIVDHYLEAMEAAA